MRSCKVRRSAEIRGTCKGQPGVGESASGRTQCFLEVELSELRFQCLGNRTCEAIQEDS